MMEDGGYFFRGLLDCVVMSEGVGDTCPEISSRDYYHCLLQPFPCYASRTNRAKLVKNISFMFQK